MEALSSYCYLDDDAIETTQIDRIEYSKKLYDEQERRVEKEKYIRDVLLQDYVSKIRNHPSRYDYLNIISKAQDEVGKRLKKDRPHLETIKSFFVEDFLNNDKTFKITSIISYGYEGYSWRFELTGHGKNIYIEIPVVGRISTKNIEHARYGMFAFGVCESDHCYRTLKESYRIKEISEFIKEYFKGEDKEEV